MGRNSSKSAPKKIFGALIIFVVAVILSFFGVEYDLFDLGNEENNIEGGTPLEIHFIDLGKYDDNDTGESIYIKLDSIDVLVDGGDRYDSTKQAISEVINNNSKDKILDYVIATHPDGDHIGSLDDIILNYEVKNVLTFYGDHTTTAYDNFVDAVDGENLVSECSVIQAVNNEGSCKSQIKLGNNVNIDIINTGNYQDNETNGRSIVFVLNAYGTKVLLTGDADNGSESDLERNYMNIVGDIDILKAVHHGTKEGTSLDFLQVTKPEVVIITNGNYFGNKHGHPSYQAINRIYQNNSNTKIYAVVGGNVDSCLVTTSESYECEVTDRFIDRNGTIKVVIDNDGYKISSERNEVPIELSSTTFWETHPEKEYSYNR